MPQDKNGNISNVFLKKGDFLRSLWSGLFPHGIFETTFSYFEKVTGLIAEKVVLGAKRTKCIAWGI